MTIVYPSIILVEFATDPVPGAMYYIERNTRTDVFVRLVSEYTRP